MRTSWKLQNLHRSALVCRIQAELAKFKHKPVSSSWDIRNGLVGVGFGLKLSVRRSAALESTQDLDETVVGAVQRAGS